MTATYVLPALVGLRGRRLTAWLGTRQRVGMAVGADRAAVVGRAHRHRGVVRGPQRPAPRAPRRRAGQGGAGGAVRPRRAHHRGVPGAAGAAAVSRRDAGTCTRRGPGGMDMQSATTATAATTAATGVA